MTPQEKQNLITTIKAMKGGEAMAYVKQNYLDKKFITYAQFGKIMELWLQHYDMQHVDKQTQQALHSFGGEIVKPKDWAMFIEGEHISYEG